MIAYPVDLDPGFTDEALHQAMVDTACAIEVQRARWNMLRAAVGAATGLALATLAVASGRAARLVQNLERVLEAYLRLGDRRRVFRELQHTTADDELVIAAYCASWDLERSDVEVISGRAFITWRGLQTLAARHVEKRAQETKQIGRMEHV